MPEKKCDGCVKIRSDEWNLTKELAASNRRRFVVIIILASLLLTTVFAFLWHINTESKTQDNLEIACSASGDDYLDRHA